MCQSWSDGGAQGDGRKTLGQMHDIHSPYPHRGRRRAAYRVLTSVSSIESCADITLSTFFLLLSCISPANNSSSSMKYAF